MNKEQTLEEKWENAGLENNFIFYHVFHNNPDLCKILLEILLKIEIDHIEMHNEETIIVDYEAKGVRLDVYAKNETQAFNLEMQVADTKDLTKRIRYYQALIDVDCLKSGELYNNLKDSYVIFICMKDIFGMGLPVYRFENICSENINLSLNDKTYKYFFIAPNCDKLTDKKQFAFFNFLTYKKQEDPFTEKLAQLTQNAKINLQVRNKYMEYERLKAYARLDGLAEGRAEGLEEGRAEGRAKGLEEGRAEGLEKGRAVGLKEGRTEGLKEGRAEGLEEGRAEGLEEGKAEGLKEGKAEGLKEGKLEAALKTAIIAVQEFNLDPETVAEKFGVDFIILKKALETKD